jgi:hypothetical protein
LRSPSEEPTTTISSPALVSIGAASRRAVVSIPGTPPRSKKVGDFPPSSSWDRLKTERSRSCGVESTA